jgi:hypothetical protein
MIAVEFSKKKDLKTHIRNRVRQMINKTKSASYQGDESSPMNMMLAEFPQLSQTLEKLMSPQYKLFVDDIQWVAPKPTTFKIILPNGQFYSLIWNEKDFIAKIAGTRYDILILKELQRATKAISELLQYGPIDIHMSPQDMTQQRLVPAKEEPKEEEPEEKV